MQSSDQQSPMLVLGIESSCDETAAALVRGSQVLSTAVWSQVAIHEKYGGVVPEIASRAHVRQIIPVIEQALDQAKVKLADLDGIAVTYGPGLVGALLVGVQVAKSLAYVLGKPVIGINHLEGHLCAAFLDVAADEQPVYPHMALLVSGGNSEIVKVEEFGRYVSLGSTRDDAAGEAFDKVGKLLGLGYPAGPRIDKLAESGDTTAIAFPRSMRGRGLDFSFSGLKTSASSYLKKHGLPEGQALADFCASFQAAVVEQLIEKVAAAQTEHGPLDLILSGGVACNRGLRAAAKNLTDKIGCKIHIPPPKYCTDNAAMIAYAGGQRLARGESSPLSLNATASLSLQ